MFTGTIQAPSNRLRTPIVAALLIGVFSAGAATGVGIVRVIESGTHGGAAAAAATMGRRNLPGLYAIPGWSTTVSPAPGLSPTRNLPGPYAIPGWSAAGPYLSGSNLSGLYAIPGWSAAGPYLSGSNLSGLYAIPGWSAAVLPAPGSNLSGLYAIPGWGAGASSANTSGDIVRGWLARSK